MAFGNKSEGERRIVEFSLNIRHGTYESRQLDIIFNKVLPRHKNRVLGELITAMNRNSQDPNYKIANEKYREIGNLQDAINQQNKKETKKIIKEIKESAKQHYQEAEQETGFNQYVLSKAMSVQSFAEPWYGNHVCQQILNCEANDVIEKFYRFRVYNKWTKTTKGLTKNFVRWYSKRKSVNSFTSGTMQAMKLDIEEKQIRIGRSRKAGQLRLPLRISKRGNEQDIWELFKTLEVKAIRVVRKFINNKWKFFAQFTVVYDKPIVQNYLNTAGRVAFDIGLYKLDIMSDDGVYVRIQYDMDGLIKRKTEETKESQRLLDEARRKANPTKYNEDGTYKRGNKERWVQTEEITNLSAKIKSLQGQMARIRTQHNGYIANQIRNLGDNVITEKLNVKEWQERVKKADGNYKNFGGPIHLGAPAQILINVERKARQYNELDVYKLKPSKHCPSCGNNKGKEHDHTVKEYECEECGFTANRDVVSVMNQLGVDTDTGEYTKELQDSIMENVDKVLWSTSPF